MINRSNIARSLWVIIYMLVLFSNGINAKSLVPDHIPTDAELFNALSDSCLEIQRIKDLFKQGYIDSAKFELARYFKNKAGDRYYFDWKRFKDRFREYRIIFPEAKKMHYNFAKYQMDHFGAETCWQLPFYDLTGEKVTAYQLRHLARQQKSADMALVYYYENEDLRYLDYFVRQVADLNRAFYEGEYDDAGNGIYEYYRAGRRIHNWLFAHNAYLASDQYTYEDQLLLIRTFLHHGAQLAERTAKYSPGNHHTKGLVALFEIAAFLPDFEDSDDWIRQATDGLLQHMRREINSDGFQFERSVHYHKGDIENYFRVYQLARINQIPLPEEYRQKLYKMFYALIQLAQPNRRLPVLQDDTDRPFAENNRIDGVMTLGTILFQEGQFRYFAADHVRPDYYWLVRQSQLEQLNNIAPVAPTIASTELQETGYYVMRNGWAKNDCYMTVTAGLCEEKPDHQHADMLGLVAYAKGNEILPNYQVKYNYPDYIDFKNSWVKNVALVDSIPQGKKWKQNRGKSGFGKWLDLPKPEVLTWLRTNDFDYFAGRHDGYEEIGVLYNREVLFVKDGFWIVRDHFQSDSLHLYQQLWQGDYRKVNSQTVRSEYQDGSGLIIRQLTGADYRIVKGRKRDKGNIYFAVEDQADFSFTTLLIPLEPGVGESSNESRISVVAGKEETVILDLFRVDAEWIISDESENIYLLGLKELTGRRGSVMFAMPTTVCAQKFRKGYRVIYLGSDPDEMTFSGRHVEKLSDRIIYLK